MRDWIYERDFAEMAEEDLPWERLRGKCILYTGATGFLGRYVVRTLCGLSRKKNLGLKLLLFRRGGRRRDGLWEDPLPFPEVRWLEGEITRNFLPEEVRLDIIIHSASPANARAIAADPMGVVETNLMATHTLLERAVETRAVFLYVSSGAVYPRREGLVPEEAFSPTQEGGGGESFYGRCKAAGELLCETYRRGARLDCRVVRPFSIYGPGERLDSGRCFPDFLRRTLQGEPIEVRGPGTQMRSYCYLSDFTTGLLTVLLKGESAVYNLGNEDNACSIRALAEEISKWAGLPVLPPALPLGRAGENDIYLPDTTKLRALGWRPRVGLDECIRRTLYAYRNS